jgi:solute carrier family 25 phosphate transporter 3
LLTPLDLVKCRKQIFPNIYTNLGTGLNLLWKENGLRGIYLGWKPTLIGYALQGSTKYGFYELNKDIYKSLFGRFSEKYKTIGYLLSSAFAEVLADCILCPFEALKVRAQTDLTGKFPSGLLKGFNEVKKEGVNGFYKGLLPLICRQVPNTMIKFATYENTVRLFYKYLLTKPKSEYNKNAKLTVTFVSGYISGIFCCLVSNPADTIVSKINANKLFSNKNIFTSVRIIYNDIGFFGLWRGLSTRILMIGTLSALEWLIYDFFKTLKGLETTGG